MVFKVYTGGVFGMVRCVYETDLTPTSMLHLRLILTLFGEKDSHFERTFPTFKEALDGDVSID